MSWQTSLVHWRTETAISTFSDRSISLFRHIIKSKIICGRLISKIIFKNLCASIIWAILHWQQHFSSVGTKCWLSSGRFLVHLMLLFFSPLLLLLAVLPCNIARCDALNSYMKRVKIMKCNWGKENWLFFSCVSWLDYVELHELHWYCSNGPEWNMLPGDRNLVANHNLKIWKRILLTLIIPADHCPKHW